ncbi:MAG: hypothetical protein AB7O98_16510 [Hyphomonadaceae bacterium]
MLRAALVFLALASAPAFAVERPDAPACVANGAGDRNGPVFAIPVQFEDDPPDDVHMAPRCNVETMALSVHNVGALRDIYENVELDAQSADGPYVEREVRIFDALIAQIQARVAESGDEPVRLLIYAHGGMVFHEDAVLDAESLAPAMMADGYTPLFLIWTSDPFTSYGNRLCCVMDGHEEPIWQGYFAPVRVIGDLISGVGRAPEAYGKQFLRFVDSLLPGISQRAYRLSGREYRTDRAYLPAACESREAESASDGWNNASVILPLYCDTDDLNDDARPPGGREVAYYANLPVRAVATGAQGIGASAWDNMVRRTRMAFMASPEFVQQARYLHDGVDCAAFTRVGARASYAPTQAERDAEGGRRRESGTFQRFFERLNCELSREPLAGRVEVHFYGHSMGAIVGDELLRRFPTMPYRRIVYMAAADSIRDFSNAALPIIEDPSREVEFFNLMLHPMAESREMHGYGVVPQGSLLEWIDEMFEGPRSPDDRRMGKWDNIRDAYQYFPPDAMPRMTFRVFALQYETPERFGSECQTMANPEDTEEPLMRCHPTEHGEFNQYSFWRERYLRGHTFEPPPRDVMAD